MPSVPPRSPHHEPQQARSRAMVAIILDACARVLVKYDLSGFNTNKVAEAAGVSVGSLHQYFPNKNALLVALSKRHVFEMKAALRLGLTSDQSEPLPEIVARLIRAFLRAHAIEPELHRVLSVNSWQRKTAQINDSNHLDIIQTDDRDVYRWLRALLESHRKSLLPKNLDLATTLMMQTVHGLVHSVVIEKTPTASNKEVELEILNIVLRYLLKPSC